MKKQRLGVALAGTQAVTKRRLYYQLKMPSKDWQLKQQIEQVLGIEPGYGHKRMALHLKINKKRIRRVMKLFGLKPYRRRPKKFRKKRDRGLQTPYPNLLKTVPFPAKANIIFVSDFTYLRYYGKFIYLATIMDIYSREIKGFELSTKHDSNLVSNTLLIAISRQGPPQILHSDQGMEYTSNNYLSLVKESNIQVSMSDKASPWQNGYQESFYSQFKLEFGDPDRFESLGQLAEAISQHIHHYNHRRIHVKLKMPPAVYAQRQRENALTAVR